MNKLDPLLKRVLAVAHRAEQVADLECEANAPRGLVQRVARSAALSTDSQRSLLELMVQRGAAISALVGGVTLSIQFAAAGGVSFGLWQQAITHGAGLFRVFLP